MCFHFRLSLNKIVLSAKIEELLPLVDRYEQAWTKLEDFNRRFPEDMKKSILQQAIQGKLVEQRPEEGTAQELMPRFRPKSSASSSQARSKKKSPCLKSLRTKSPLRFPMGGCG